MRVMGCSASLPTPRATTVHVVSPVVPHLFRGSASFDPGTSGHGGVLDETPRTAINVGNAIRFLADKGVYSRDTDFRRILFHRIRFPDRAPASERLHYEQAQRNLLRLYALVVNGEVRAVQPPLDSQLDMDDLGNLYVFPAPFRDRADFIVQRLQIGNTCVHNARTIVQQYAIFRTEILAAQASGTEPVLVPHVIDLAVYWRNIATSDALTALVFHRGGAPVKAMLLSTLEEGSKLASTDQPQDWVQLLDQYGPALIAEFHVFPGFDDETEKHHVGLPTGSCIGVDGLPRLYVNHLSIISAPRQSPSPSPSPPLPLLVLLLSDTPWYCLLHVGTAQTDCTFSSRIRARRENNFLRPTIRTSRGAALLQSSSRPRSTRCAPELLSVMGSSGLNLIAATPCMCTLTMGRPQHSGPASMG